MNYRSLQMNKRYLQTPQHIPIRYPIEKVRKGVKIASLWRDHLILRRGACKFCRDRGRGSLRWCLNVGSKGRQKIIFHVIFIFFCAYYRYMYIVYMYTECSNFIWLLICIYSIIVSTTIVIEGGSGVHPPEFFWGNFHTKWCHYVLGYYVTKRG